MASHFFPDVEGDVASIFVSYFQRAPEFAAMQHYVGVYESLQADPATAGNAFNLLAAHIYADGVAHQEVPAGPTISESWYVAYLYGNVLGRAPDADGQAYWVAQLESGAIARAELVGTFIAAALYENDRDRDYLFNRTLVAKEFAEWENSNPQVLPTLKYNAAEVLLGVTENDATVEAARERLESHTGPVGESRNLTTGIDTLEGTTGNDTFNAVFQHDADWASTLTPFDTVDGDLGVDTLNLYVGQRLSVSDDLPDGLPGANAVFPGTATVRNIEIVNVFNGASSEGSLRDVGNYQGIQEFWQIGTAAGVGNVGEGVLVGFAEVDEFFAAVELRDGIAAARIALDGAGANGQNALLVVRGHDLSAVEVAGSLGGAETDFRLGVVAGKDVTALAISTEVDIELSVRVNPRVNTANVRVDTLDLSGSTGNIVLDIDEFQALQLVGPGAALNVAFGAGDDTIVFEGRDLTLRDRIDGGEGYDTVVLTQDGKLQTQGYDAIARLQNIEQLVFAGANVDLDAGQLADFDLKVQGTGVVTVRQLATDQGLTVASSVEARTIPYKVVLQDAAADVNVTMDQAATFLEVGGAVGGRAGTLVVDGEGALFFDNSISGKFAVIDASGLEGWKVEEGAGMPFPGMDVDGDVSVGLFLMSMRVTVTDHGVITELQGSGMSGAVVETVLLNPETMDLILLNIDVMGDDRAELDLPDIPWYTSNSSTYGKMDVLVDFNSDANAGPLDYLAAPARLNKIDLQAGDTTQPLAFQAAAQAYAELLAAATDDIPFVVYFLLDGDTYVFADTVGGDAGRYDNDDFALKIVGEHQLENVWLASYESLA
ncbi:MAG: DUF4214 domain-containing protein [Pigmentiphaga sp.]|nr:DUF4214 domain-containing protein [Pigmentiphaga sp.]